MEHLVEDIIKHYTGSYHPLSLDFPAFTEEGKQNCIEKANNLLHFQYPYISASMYMNFKRTGNRIDFEELYFRKRKVLNSLVIAEIIKKDGTYLDDIINGIYSICEESAWQLPAHNTYIRDTPQFILPDKTRPVLDLFSCETGALLATVYHLLKSSLDAVSPFICERILLELQDRIISPYLTTHFWWMGNEDEQMCNWTIWCTQNILLVASQIPLSNDIYEKIVMKSCSSADYFLKEYGDDGCCDEGAQYYHHSGLCLYLTIFLLNQICEGAFSKLYQNKKIKNIAEYICNVHVTDRYYINYADCSPILVSGRSGAREFLFGKAVNSIPLCSLAALDFVKDENKYIEDEINLYYRLLAFSYEQSIINYANEHPIPILAHNIWYESVGIFIARDNTTCIAMKAGDNNDSHNHNDTGSIIMYANERPILIDVGVENYTLKTFSPQRYEIWSMQSGYHNLPTINGMDQLAGEEYRATNVNVNLSPTSPDGCFHSISMNLEKAYPSACGIKHYTRKATFEKQGISGIISLEDNFSFSNNQQSNNVILNFMTCEEPSWMNNILKIGNIYSFSTKGVSSVDIEKIHITDSRLQIAWKNNIYRVRLHIKGTHFLLKSLNL